MRVKPILEDVFYHDGRGPSLQKVIWENNGIFLSGFEYFNPDHKPQDEVKSMKLHGVEAYSMSSDEVHGNILISGKSKASIFEVLNSSWLASFQPLHISEYKHYQIVFYDEIFDVICKKITVSDSKLEQ